MTVSSLSKQMVSVSLLTSFLLMQPCSAQMGPGGMEGGMGGGLGGMGSGYGGMGGIVLSKPRLTFNLVKGPSGKAANEKTKLKASRVKAFHYQRGTLKFKNVSFIDGEGGYGGYGGEGGYGGGAMFGGYGGEGYEGGGYGGDGQGGYGGAMGGGFTTANSTLTIYAFIFDEEVVDDRARIDLLVKLSAVRRPKRNGGYGDSMGGEDGGYGGAGAGGQGMGMGMGADMGEGMGMGMGAGMGMGMGEMLVDYVALDTLPSAKEDEAAIQSDGRIELGSLEYEILSDSIRQSIWKDDAIKMVRRYSKDPAKLVQAENTLRTLLSEEYETQLARQSYEVEQIEQRVAKLREELARRRAARARVVEVQLGRIVLEAQGLLNN